MSKRVAAIASIGVLCCFIWGANQLSSGRRCVGAFVIEAAPSSAQPVRRPGNTPLQSRFLTHIPGSMVPIDKDRKPVSGQAAQPAPAAKPESPTARWKGLGLFRVWDDGLIEELHVDHSTKKRAWFAVDS